MSDKVFDETIQVFTNRHSLSLRTGSVPVITLGNPKLQQDTALQTQ